MPSSSSNNAHDYLDVVNLLVSNYRSEKPLLDGAVLFKASRLDSLGAEMEGGAAQSHAYLLPQVAASHAPGSKGDVFIDTFPVDREHTRFFAESRLAEHLEGKEVKSYSVAEVERAVGPLVENLAHANSPAARERNQAHLERFIKMSFYESGLPHSGPDGSPTVPIERFQYSGKAAPESAKEMLGGLKKMGKDSEAQAKQSYAKTRPSDAAISISVMEAANPSAARAFKVLKNAVQRDHADSVMAKYGDLSPKAFVEAIKNEPPSEYQHRILKLAQGLSSSLSSPDSAIRDRASAVAKQLGMLNPDTATIKDVGQAIVRINQASKGAGLSGSVGRPMPPSSDRSLSR